MPELVGVLVLFDTRLILLLLIVVAAAVAICVSVFVFPLPSLSCLCLFHCNCLYSQYRFCIFLVLKLFVLD